MTKRGIDAFIVPSTDPHMSEYVAPHWKSREWITGFNGSAGTAVITLDQAGLWTDSRYFLQAADQLANTGINLYKEMLPETPSIAEFLCKSLPEGSTVGIDGKVFSISEAEKLKEALSSKEINIDTFADPMAELWAARPSLPQTAPFIHQEKYAGKSCIEKIDTIRKELASHQCESLLLCALDEIAWALNLRGTDVKCNPVVISYLFIGKSETVFFISPKKLTPEVAEYLKEQRVKTADYHTIEPFLQQVDDASLLLTPAKTNYATLLAINPHCRVKRADSPVALLKAIRNKQEIAGMHNAMKKDGVAMVRFLKWLEENRSSGQETELSVDAKLQELRAQQELYKGPSFDTIAGYKEHGAIIHYSATPESSVSLHPKGFLLLDSGAQYLDGTTDITRTIALGELTEEEKTDYTLVLKGHIDLAMAKFPAGTRGVQLDVLARMPIWQQGMNYLHGTGHGIGHFLNVHEGPQSIRTNENPVTLQPGMLLSNEPGVYKAGSHGVRTESLMLVVESQEGMFGQYYAFETATLCPICKKGIVKSLLNSEEIEWLNKYHQKVYQTLAPLLNEEEQSWLQQATSKL